MPRRRWSAASRIRWALAVSAATAVPPVLAAQARPGSLAEISLDSLLAVPVEAAAKHAQLVREVPASVTVLTGDEIARMGYRSLTEILAAVRGLYLTDDRNYAYVGVRGFSRPSDYNNRLLVLVNGHKMYEGFYGGTVLETIAGVDPALIERVEIVRGPGSVLYGTTAMLAVINVITRTGADLEGVTASARAGTNATADVGGAWGRRAGGVDWALWGRYTRTDGEKLRFAEYDTTATRGVAENLDWERAWTVGAHATHGGATLTGMVATRDKGVPTASYGTDFGADERTLDRRAFLEARLNQDLGAAAQLSLRGAWDGYWYRGQYPYGASLLDATDAHRIEAEVRVLWDPVRRHRLTVGAEVQHHYRADYRTWDAGVASYNADFPFTQVIVSVQDEVAVAPWLRLVGGVSHSFHTDGADAATPRAAVLLYPDSATTVKLLYGEGFRAPSAYERRYGEAASDWEVNPDLRPERLRTGEVVVERRLSSVLHAGASAFVNVITGMIDPVEEGDPPVGRFINAQSVTALGAELELTARGPGIMVRGSYAFHHATDNTTDERVSNAPLHLLRLSSAASAWNLGTIAGEVRLDAGRRTIAGAAVPVVANVDLGVTSRPLMGGLRAGVRVTNLLDRANVVPAGVEHRQQVLPQARRQLIVSLTWTP